MRPYFNLLMILISDYNRLLVQFRSGPAGFSPDRWIELQLAGMRQRLIAQMSSEGYLDSSTAPSIVANRDPLAEAYSEMLLHINGDIDLETPSSSQHVSSESRPPTSVVSGRCEETSDSKLHRSAPGSVSFNSDASGYL